MESPTFKLAKGADSNTVAVSLSQVGVRVNVGDGVSEGCSSVVAVGVSVGIFVCACFRVGGTKKKRDAVGDGVSVSGGSDVGVVVSVRVSDGLTGIAGWSVGEEAMAVWVKRTEAN